MRRRYTSDVPCLLIIRTIPGEAEELADLLADNRIAEMAEMDNKMLAEVFSQMTEIDLSLSGFNDIDIENISSLLQDSIMEGIDDVKSQSETMLHRLRFDSTEIPMTDDEYNCLKDTLDEYVDENGVVYGFVGWLLNDRTC